LQGACDKADANIEPHPLWEYPCQALGNPFKLLDFDFKSRMPETNFAIEKTIMISNFSKDLNGNLILQTLLMKF